VDRLEDDIHIHAVVCSSDLTTVIKPSRRLYSSDLLLIQLRRLDNRGRNEVETTGFDWLKLIVVSQSRCDAVHDN